MQRSFISGVCQLQYSHAGCGNWLAEETAPGMGIMNEWERGRIYYNSRPWVRLFVLQGINGRRFYQWE